MDAPTPHHTVLLNEAVDALITNTNGCYIDGTFGRGGHSALILERLASQARLMGIDKDDDAITAARQRFGHDSRFEILKGSFAQLKASVEQRGLLGKVSGILLDLGVSSPQLDQAERGFSFLHDGPLDMRMDVTQGQTAEQWVNTAQEKEIARVIKEYGEERFAKRMARAIVTERQQKTITTTHQLSKIIADAHPAWEKGKNPATRAFQAIRIYINDELKDLESVLEQSLDVLATGGRMAIISFHSLEDHRVKRFIRKHAKGDNYPAGLPVTEDMLNKRLRTVAKQVRPSQQEIDDNPRARSAIMRVAEKIA